MDRFRGRILPGWIAMAIVLSTATGLARGRQRSAPPGSESQPVPVQLLGLDFEETAAGTVIGLQATGPVTNHTAYQASPERLVIELTGVRAEDLPPVAQVDTAEVVEIHAATEDGAVPRTRLELVRSVGGRAQLAVDPESPNRLLITVPRGTTRTAAATKAPTPAAVAKRPAPQVLAKAEPKPARQAPAPRQAPTQAEVKTEPTPRVSTPPVSRPPVVRSAAVPARSNDTSTSTVAARTPQRSESTSSRRSNTMWASSLERPSYPRSPTRPLELSASPQPARTVVTPAPEPVVATPLVAESWDDARPAASQQQRRRRVELLSATAETSSDGTVLIRLDATGPLQAKTFRLDSPPRLVVDLPGVVNKVDWGIRAVRRGPVSRMRVAQNQPLPNAITRFVVHLEEAGVPSQVHPGPSGLVITLGAQSAAPSRAPVQLASARPSQPSNLFTAPPPVTSAATSQPPLAPPMSPSPAVASPAGPPATMTSVDLANLGRPLDTAASRPIQPLGASLPPSMPMRETASSSGGLVTTSGAAGAQGEGATYQTRSLTNKEPIYTGEPISANWKNADLQDVFRFFGEYGRMNIIIDEAVKGKTITMDVVDVPWDQLMALVLQTNELGQSVDGNVVRIAPLSDLAREEQQKKALREAQELAQDTVSISKQLSYANGGDAESLLTKVLSSRGEVQRDDRTNTIILKDIPSRVQEAEQLLELLDKPTRQVMIEARIVETTKDFSRAAGITWGFNYIADRAFGNTTGFRFPRSYTADYAVNLPVDAATSSLGLSFRNILNTFQLDLAITNAESNGRARIISSPRVMVQNNETATIESGVQIPITSTTATEIEITFVSASLKLEVTPQITADDNVIMEVIIENNQPLFTQAVGGNAPISTRQAETTVAVPNGGTTVIGGIYQVNEGVSQSRVPFFSRIPLLGWLFRNKSVDRTNDEMIIFITPTIQES